MATRTRSIPRQDQPCPPGATHRRDTPLGSGELQRLLALKRRGKSEEWLASHYGVTPKEIRLVLRTPRPKPRPQPSPNESEAVSA